MSFMKKIHIRIILKENHNSGSRMYYDSDLGILRRNGQASPVSYVASPAIVLSKNKKALKKAQTGSNKTTVKKCNMA